MTTHAGTRNVLESASRKMAEEVEPSLAHISRKETHGAICKLAMTNCKIHQESVTQLLVVPPHMRISLHASLRIMMRARVDARLAVPTSWRHFIAG